MSHKKAQEAQNKIQQGSRCLLFGFVPFALFRG
jgi:hypothetical protein